MMRQCSAVSFYIYVVMVIFAQKVKTNSPWSSAVKTGMAASIFRHGLLLPLFFAYSGKEKFEFTTTLWDEKL